MWLQILPAASIIRCFMSTVAILIAPSMCCSASFKPVLKSQLDILLFPIIVSADKNNRCPVTCNSATAVLQISHFLPIHHSRFISQTHPVNCPSPLRFVATDLLFTMRTLRSIFTLTITALSYTALRLCVKLPVSCVSAAKSYSSSARLILCKPIGSCWGKDSRAVPARARPQDSWIIYSSTDRQHWAFSLSKPFFTCKWSPC